MSDTISRQAAIDALNGIINRFEQILRNIRETKEDDSVCGMCEYDGAYIGQSGDWCNECPGFDKNDCFKLSDKCRKRWLESAGLPSAQPETHEERTETHACGLIDRQAVFYALDNIKIPRNASWYPYYQQALTAVSQLPSVQPEPSEITDEQAILHLQSTGWMQNHDREMYESGLRERLADDSGSYDALTPRKDTISRQAAIDVEGLDEQIRCEMCRNPMHTDRGCDGNCKYDEKLYERIMQILGERMKPLPSAQPNIEEDEDIPMEYFENGGI